MAGPAIVGIPFLSGPLTGIGTASLTSGSTTIGNGLFVWGYIQSGNAGSGYTGFSVADGGNIWNVRTVFKNGGRSVFCAWTTVTSGGARSIVVTGSGGAGGMFGGVGGGEFTIPGAISADQIGPGTAFAASPAVVTAGGVDSGTTDLVLTAIGIGGGGTNSNIATPPATGYTNVYGNNNDSTDSSGEVAYRINTTAVTDSTTWTVGGFGVDGSAAAVWSFQFGTIAPTDPPQCYFQEEVDDYNQFEDFQGFQNAPAAIDNDMAVARVELPDATEDPIIDDEALYPSYWAQPPPNDDLPQQSTVIDADEQPEDPDEDFGFSDVQSQAAVIIADQIYAECSDNQLDDADEPYEVAEYPLAGDVQSNQVFVEDASGVFEEPDEPYDNFDYQPVDFASDQGSLFEDASNQPEDVDEDFAFFAAPIAVDVTAPDQFSTVDDASAQLEDFDEPFDTVDQPLSDNQVIQSNQIFVDDAADQLEDFDDTYNFQNDPLSADLPVAPNLHRLVMDVNTGRLGWIVSGTPAGSPILIQLLD